MTEEQKQAIKDAAAALERALSAAGGDFTLVLDRVVMQRMEDRWPRYVYEIRITEAVGVK